MRAPLRTGALRSVDGRCLSGTASMTALEVAVSTHYFTLLHLFKESGKLDADVLANGEVLVPVNMVKRETDRVSLAAIYARMRGLIPTHGMTRDLSPVIDVLRGWHSISLPRLSRFVKVRAG